ncbi:hypothetical protein BCR25_16890 [Enterococcus termitis]|uniref:Uncharacterized protein n=2 Tax=Enterococcus termitis TaxID=332950 RepID=A0A1E5GZQ8_9ENTE|nr:hypothetical protein BCR25_16890 [Enterococcus termitis]
MSVMINQGDKVKYIGTALPKYTGKILKVKKCLVNDNFILSLPDDDKHILELKWGDRDGTIC